MPIRKDQVHRYPKDWQAIRTIVLARAGGKCEEPGCEVDNYAVGARGNDGAWYSEREIHNMKSDIGEMLWPEGFPKIIRIVLTIAHLDHNPENNSLDNLAALCQLHHNRHDIEHRTATRRATLAQKRKEREARRSGQPLMPDGWVQTEMPDPDQPETTEAGAEVTEVAAAAAATSPSQGAA